VVDQRATDRDRGAHADPGCAGGGAARLLNQGAKAFLAACQGELPTIASVTEMSQLLVLRHGLGRAWSQFMSKYPLVLTPTWTQLPFEHGFDATTLAGAAATVEMLRPVQPANLLGLPSACVPAGRDAASGLPIGVLLTGPRFREDLCLDAAEVIESRLGLVTPIDPLF
jgi:amidase